MFVLCSIVVGCVYGGDSPVAFTSLLVFCAPLLLVFGCAGLIACLEVFVVCIAMFICVFGFERVVGYTVD